MDKIAVLVTTQHRGVFFGYVGAADSLNERSLYLDGCRNAIYWTGKAGFLGLAATGPEPESRIGATAPRVLIHDITSVSLCTAEAAEKWDNWS